MTDGNEKLYDFKRRSDESGLECKDPSLTVQSDAEDADINVIISRFGIGQGVPMGLRMPESTDFGDVVFDYQTAQNYLIAADQAFMTLPADVRRRFDHDPQAFIDFVDDPKNGDELIKMGLREFKAPPPVDNPPASADA